MKRWIRCLGWFLLLALVLACALPSLDETPGEPARVVASRTPTPTSTPEATASPVKLPATFTPTPAPSSTPTPPATDPRLVPGEVQLFPLTLYAGDRLSMDVDPVLPAEVAADLPENIAVTLSLAGHGTFTTTVAPMGLNGEPQARFYWVTALPDGVSAATASAASATTSAAPATTSAASATTSAAPATTSAASATTSAAPATTLAVTVTLSLPPSVADPDPANNVVALSVPLLPRSALPPPEPAAAWVVTETAGFEIHYITGSAAERDLPLVMEEARAAYAAVTARLGETQEQVDFYLLDRVVGQGGYAAPDWVAVSYVDRKYSPVRLDLVLEHELIHRLDGAIGCANAPSLMREGLAVALSGGHYRPESLRDKAASLLATTQYVPLGELVRDFYTHQHEVGYLEAGALVRYVTDVHGWQALTGACRAASEADGDEVQRFEAALAPLGFETLADLEAAWQAWLAASPNAPLDPTLLGLELDLMDTMRRYQARYDPAAHFIEGILFSPAEAERRDIVADFVRSPREPEPVALELVLAMAQEALGHQDTAMLAYLLESLDTALVDGVAAAPLVRDVHTVTLLAMAQELEPYRLVLEESGRYRLYALDRGVWPQPRVLTAQQLNGVWELSAPRWSE